MSKIYISLADSRAKGFMKWSDAHPERPGEARTVAGEGAVMAAPDIAQAVNDGRTAVSSVARPRRRYAVKRRDRPGSTRDTIFSSRAKSAGGLASPTCCVPVQGRVGALQLFARGG